MTGEEAYRIWAPDDGIWSPWAKPIAFVDGKDLPHRSTEDRPLPPAPDLACVPAADDPTAVILNLPGAVSVQVGLALAERGCRPVPLFNGADDFMSIIDTLPVRNGLRAGAPRLAALALPADAPPVFLLDLQRDGGGRRPAPGDFDNRWVVFPQDFPSAAFLAGRGIRKALLVQSGRETVSVDLAHVLHRWQRGGIELWRLDLTRPPAVRVDVPRPSSFGSLWRRVGVMLGLRPNAAGGFGRQVPEPGSGGGFG